jgi:hypothetical protein
MNEKSLVILEGIEELLEGDSSGSGPMTFFKIGRRFGLSWIPWQNSPIFAVFQSTQAASKWEVGSAFRLSVTEFSTITMESDPPRMTFVLRDRPIARTFCARDRPFFFYSILIEQLLLNGVAVIADNYVVTITPELIEMDFEVPEIDLQSGDFGTLEEFWAGAMRFSGEVLWYFDSMRLLSPKSLPSVAVAARASHARLMKGIANHFAGQDSILPITDWRSQLTPDGRVIDPSATRASIYFHGLPLPLLTEALPFVLEVFPDEYTDAEREAGWSELEIEFETYCTQLDHLLPDERRHNSDRDECFRVLSYDIRRIEKSHPAFQSPEALGAIWCERLLQAYCMYHPHSSYHQGMLDFLQPIFLVFFQDWDWAVSEGHGDRLAKAFWCFDAFLKSTNQVVFLETVSDASKVIVHKIRKVFKKVAPVVWVWLRLTGLQKLMWMHSDLALMYKRTFKNIWPYWLQIHCSLAPARWLPCVTGAFLLAAFKSMLDLEECTLSAISDAFPKTLRGVDSTEVGKIALWLYDSMPKEKDEVAPAQPESDLEFFEPAWRIQGT